VNQAGRYQILEELGRGATGVVYRATDPAIGRTVAIKSVRLSDVGDAEEKRLVRDKLLREAQSAGILSHPNIVTIYDVFESGELAYISMEYVDGVSLEELLRAGTLPEREKFLQFLRQIAEALDYAHRKEIVHRDIKPANIIVCGRQPGAEQVAKIAGFGVATFLASEVAHNGTLIGTPNYMSPEQIQGLPVGGKADQFSLAAVIYEVLCGAKPFAAENLQAVLYSICKQNPKPVEQVNPRLNETVGKVMARGLAKEPEERFSSCCDFVAALSFALDECPEWKPVAPAGELKGSGIRRLAPAVAIEQPSAREERIKAAAAAVAIGAGGELPGRERTARRSEATQLRKQNSAAKRFGLIVALCFAVAAACIFIVRMNSGPSVPIQVLDPKAGSSVPPPEQSVPPPEDKKAAAKESAPAPAPADLTPAPEQSLQPPATAPPAATPEEKPAEQPAAPPPTTASEPKPDATPSEAKPDATPVIADVELVTDPPGGKVVVDGRRSCLSPCSLPLSSGRHTLKADLAGYNVAQKIIQVPTDGNVFLPLVRSVGVLLVSSEPSGSKVAVDGKNYGATPVTLHLTAGSHHLTLSDGDRRHDETIEIDPEGVHTRTFRW
jgi:tRNA A-37 threonylcarbamoyl transferase component Bud32